MDLVKTCLLYALIFGFFAGALKLLHIVLRKHWLREMTNISSVLALTMIAVTFVLLIYRIDSEGYNWFDGWTWLLIGVGVIATFFRIKYSNYDPHHIFDKMNIILMVIGIVIATRIAIALLMWFSEVTYDTDVLMWVIRAICLIMLVGAACAIIYGWKEYDSYYIWLGVPVLVCSFAMSYFMWFELDGLVASLTA